MKKFLIIGNLNSFTYKEVFPLLMKDLLGLGVNYVKSFQSNDGLVSFGNICWFTNMFNVKRVNMLELTKTYSPIEYPRYDNYDAIEVSKVKDIPMDYDGIMGVPTTFLMKHNPNQFEIVGQATGNSAINGFGEKANYVKHTKGQGWRTNIGWEVEVIKGVDQTIIALYKSKLMWYNDIVDIDK